MTPKEELAYNYDHHSHLHCWAQKQPSACGIPLEKHTQCCLCDITPPSPEVMQKVDAQIGRAVERLGSEAPEAVDERVCEKNCPDYSGMKELHAAECSCSCHHSKEER